MIAGLRYNWQILENFNQKNNDIVRF